MEALKGRKKTLNLSYYLIISRKYLVNTKSGSRFKKVF